MLGGDLFLYFQVTENSKINFGIGIINETYYRKKKIFEAVSYMLEHNIKIFNVEFFLCFNPQVMQY